MSHLQKAPRDGTKWRFIPTCAWCRIDTQFIWKICNRHQGTVPQKDFFPMPTANHPINLNFYIIEGGGGIISITPRLSGIRTHNISADRH